jgi:hypothetical protein
MKEILIALAACAVATANLAQDPGQFVGRWTAKFRAANGADAAAAVQVENGKGTWESKGRSRANPCLGLANPVTLTEVAPGRYTMLVEGSKALAGCPDLELKVERKSPTEYLAAFPDGRPIVFTRD